MRRNFVFLKKLKIYRTEHIRRSLNFNQDYLKRMQTNIMLYLPQNT